LAKAGGQIWFKMAEFVVLAKLMLLLIVVVVVEVVVSFLKFVVVSLEKGDILQNIPE